MCLRAKIWGVQLEKLAIAGKFRGAIDEEDIPMNEDASKRSGGRSTWLLALPFVALLWVPFYNALEPTLWGIPFFYWYQFLWVVLTSALIIWVHSKND